MPLTPDQPFPKKQGDNIRSKDWNDAVNELIRLDAAKLNLAGGAVTGALSVTGALGVATETANAGIRLDGKGLWAMLAVNLGDHSYNSMVKSGDRALIYGSKTIGSPGGGFVLAPWANATSGLRLDADGNVGIGTPTPGAKLSVVATGSAEIAGTAQSLTFRTTAGSLGTKKGDEFSLASIGFFSGNNSSLGIRALRVSDGTDWNSTAIGLGMDVDNTPRAGAALWLNASGNVGVGTANPGSMRMLVAGVTSWNTGVGLTGNSTGGIGLSIENTTAGGHKYVLISGGTGNGPGNLNGAFGLYDDTANAYRLVVDSGGQVGVGLGDPGFRLDVLGRVRLREGGGSAGHWLYQGGADRSFIGLASDTHVGFWGNTGWGLVMNVTNGNVGIGTTNPTRARLEVSGSMPNNTGAYGYINSGGAGNTTSAQAGIQYSVWSNQRMAAAEFNAFSDERIKHVRGRSDGAADLQTLLAIEVTDYTYRDVLEKGDGPHKKLVAQQVERVFPQAVSRQTEVVPDIFRPAPYDGGWVALATDLKAGDRVRLISEKAEGVYEVLEAEQDRFRTDFAPEGDRVFVYGREVGDFRALDYDAVAMLNVSATQQLKREKDEEVRALRAECEELRASHDALAERLRLLEGGPEVAHILAGAKNGSNGNGRH